VTNIRILKGYSQWYCEFSNLLQVTVLFFMCWRFLYTVTHSHSETQILIKQNVRTVHTNFDMELIF